MLRRTMIAGLAALLSLLGGAAFGSDRFPIYWIGSQGEAFRVAAGDVNGDGMGDLVLVSNTQASPTSPQRAFVRSGINGSLVHTWTPSLPNLWGFQGSTVKVVGDLDLDGLADVALSIASPVPPLTAVVEVRSGLDASVMAIIPPPAVSNALLIGSTIAGGGDLDGDGWPELLVRGDYQIPGCYIGHAVYDFEAPGFGLQSYQIAWQCSQEFGSQIGPLDDVDGDGFADFYIGAPGTDVAGIAEAGWIGVFSGANGSLIASSSGTAILGQLGGNVVGLRDLTGDGKPELAVVRWGYSNRLSVLSLPSFSVVYELTAGSLGPGQQILEVDGLGDGDGDGLDDLLVRWRTAPGFSDGITAVSGPSGVPIGSIAQNYGGTALFPFGGLGDVNGDGLGDFAATPWNVGAFLPGPGAVQSLWGGWQWPNSGGVALPGVVNVHVARNFDLVGTPAVGGGARFRVVAPRRAGRSFQVAFSRDAVFPGLSLGPFLFPLVPDSLFLGSFASGIGGTLGPTGQGTVSVPIPADPNLRDVTVHASGVVYDPTGPLGIGCVLTRVTFAIQ